MPWPFLLALILAFGFDDLTGTAALPREVVAGRVASMLSAFVAVGVAAWVAGAYFAARFRKDGFAYTVTRRFQRTTNAFDWVTLGVFGWSMVALEWPRIVAWNLGLRSSIFVDEIVTLLPYIAAQVTVWAGLSLAESRLHGAVRPNSGRRQLWLRIRQALGLMLPLLLLYGLGRDCVRAWAPALYSNPVAQVGGLMLMATTVLVLAPAFVRLALPTRSLDPGPLRDRLEALGRRFNFKSSDILVWDTGGLLANAGVTGALPGFRYVLLTDALIERLPPREIEAVYGHEIGHVVHRHLAYFGFFFLGSIGLLAVMDGLVQSMLLKLGWSAPVWADSPLADLAGWLGALVLLGAYFLFVFGFLSRRFERQADVFGCRAVSCDEPECPPHVDPNLSSKPANAEHAVCPVGIQIFAEALGSVAALNGLPVEAPSWRHGSIAKRIAFLERLASAPSELSRFQTNVNRLRLSLAGALLLATFVALLLNHFA